MFNLTTTFRNDYDYEQRTYGDGNEESDIPMVASYEACVDQCGECENGTCDCLPVIITGTPYEGFCDEYKDRGPDSREVEWEVNGSKVDMSFLAWLLGSEWLEVKASIVRQLNPGVAAWWMS